MQRLDGQGVSQTRRERINSVQGSTDGESQERRRQRRPKRGATEQVSHNDSGIRGSQEMSVARGNSRYRVNEGGGRASAPRSVNSDLKLYAPAAQWGLEMSSAAQTMMAGRQNNLK